MKRARTNQQITPRSHFDNILDRAGRFVGLPGVAAVLMNYATGSSKAALVAFFIVMGILILMKWVSGDAHE